MTRGTPPLTGAAAVAVIADAHLHDIHGDYGGPPFLMDGAPLTLRSWADTRTGARAFNESVAALNAALTEISARGIRHVVLLGDYTDDGQILATRRLAARLRTWRDRAGLNFYALPGNHDVFGPHGKHNATRFVTAPGRTRLVTSDPDLAATEPDTACLSPGMFCAGQPAGLTPMAEFGLFRNPRYLHWETPFGLDDSPAARQYTARSPDGQISHRLMDASYLVEPAPGLWLLMIDANVFEPRNNRHDPTRKKAFADPGTAGWNALLRVKPFLIDWIGDVVGRARAAGKSLMAFSHYPVLDPFRDPAGAETAMFGQTTIARRTPGPAVAQTLSEVGLRQHFSGHMHVHGGGPPHGLQAVPSTAARAERPGASAPALAAGAAPAVDTDLTDICVPSLVSFPPAFVVATPGADRATVETVSLSAQPLAPDLMLFYASEAALHPHPGLDDQGLNAHGYGDLLLAQLRARAMQRLPRHWPADILRDLPDATAATVLALMLSPARTTVTLRTCIDRSVPVQIPTSATADLADVPLGILVADWYALRQAGALLLPHLSPQRLHVLQTLAALAPTAPAADDSAQRQFFCWFLLRLTGYLSRLHPRP
ncbi:metallophosphoesterase [Pseudooceanicola sediminis]|uniref:Metallophosphoesterase n=1 Tax=Pseudooceanicola sediminis TaxID=2211117 RepID=A0A399IY59_9RHOB|nr:metallophosphoesterase [Pseudooceanicola sediminis]RII37910.1 metallophosphoesterase [Pseudooceanicola sediminis]|tara:strand:- start:2869 stop:4665 length:1797 start_codon:yes stop_codon:yes gene_type:complete